MIAGLPRIAGAGLGCLLVLMATFGAARAMAAEYNLVVQPIQSPAKTRAVYQSLADYLSKATGQRIRLVTALNFLGYWETMKQDRKYDLILDAAHFTDFRDRRMHYTPLVKVADVVSFSLVTRDDNPVLEPRELIGKKVAVLPSPSMGYVRLNQLFPNMLRQPVIVKVNDAGEAVQLLKQGKVAAAMIPSPMVGGFPFLYTVESSRQVPHMALSASPRVPTAVQTAIRSAMLNAAKTPAGRSMLDHLKLGQFEPASPKIYQGYAKLLKGVYGY